MMDKAGPALVVLLPVLMVSKPRVQRLIILPASARFGARIDAQIDARELTDRRLMPRVMVTRVLPIWSDAPA